MNCGYNYSGCGCSPIGYNPFGCGGCGGYGYNNAGFGGGCGSWFAIVLVVFLLLIICGNSRIRP